MINIFLRLETKNIISQMVNYILLLTNSEKIMVCLQVQCVCTEREDFMQLRYNRISNKNYIVKQQPELHYAFSGI